MASPSSEGATAGVPIELQLATLETVAEESADDDMQQNNSAMSVEPHAEPQVDAAAVPVPGSPVPIEDSDMPPMQVAPASRQGTPDPSPLSVVTARSEVTQVTYGPFSVAGDPEAVIRHLLTGEATGPVLRMYVQTIENAMRDRLFQALAELERRASDALATRYAELQARFAGSEEAVEADAALAVSAARAEAETLVRQEHDRLHAACA